MNPKIHTTSNFSKISFKESFFVYSSGGHGGGGGHDAGPGSYEPFTPSGIIDPKIMADTLNPNERAERHNLEVRTSGANTLRHPVQNTLDTVKTGVKDTVSGFKEIGDGVKKVASIPGEVAKSIIEGTGHLAKGPYKLMTEVAKAPFTIGFNALGLAANIATMPLDILRGAARVPLILTDKLKMAANKPSQWFKQARDFTSEKVGKGFDKVSSIATNIKDKVFSVLTFGGGHGAHGGGHTPAAHH